MKKPSMLAIGVLTILLLASMQLPATASTPRHCKGLDIYFYETQDEGYAALTASEIDLLAWPLTYDQYLDATANPAIQLAPYEDLGMFELDFNNNYTIPDIPDARSPMNDVNFRRALAHMVDKDWIVNTVLKGSAERIDAPLAAPHTGYANESVIGDNYPYPYDMAVAAAVLDAAGFEDIDDDGTRNYPPDWPGRPGRPNLDPIKFCIRSDHGSGHGSDHGHRSVETRHRLIIGRELADNMRALGIPVNQIEASSDVLFPMVMDDFNYHIYTGAWSVGIHPSIYIHSMFCSSSWFPGGSNYVTGMNGSNLPNYPHLDAALEGAYYAKTNEDFVSAVKKATGLLVEYCVNIPLWSYRSWWAYRKVLVGVVNKWGYGPESEMNFLNAYKVDDPATPEDESQDPIRMGTIHAPKDLNILYSSWSYDYVVLDRVFTRLLQEDPYNLAITQPWIAQDSEITTWYDPQDDETKTKVTYWIRQDVFWHAPVTGEEVRQFTAHDVEFTIWYIYAFDDGWHWDCSVMDVHHTKIVDDFTIEVYFDVESIWAYYWISNAEMPLLPKDEYLDLLCREECVDIPITEPIDPEDPLDKIIFTGGQVIQVINCTSVNEGTLIEGADFEILATGPPEYCHNEIHFLIPLDEGDVVTICYWTPDADPHGYYLGSGTDWISTFYSIGPYYPIEIIKGVGGCAIFNCNPSHFLGAPPLGEIDWMWTWVGTEKPCSGYFQVNLFDAVSLLKAYGSRGDSVPSQNWFPGADIDPTDIGHVGLYDAVTVLGKYGQKFGTPP